MRQVIFVGGDRREGKMSQVLNLLGVDSTVFRPIGTQSRYPTVLPRSGKRPVPNSGDVLQEAFNRAFHWQVREVDAHVGFTSSLARYLGLGSQADRARLGELRAAVMSRLSSIAWDGAFVEHFLGNRRHQLLLVVRSPRLKAVLTNEFGFRVWLVPSVSVRNRFERLRQRSSKHESDNPDGRQPLSGKMTQAIMFDHRGSSYGRLFRWDQYPTRDSDKFQSITGVVTRSYDDLSFRGLSKWAVVKTIFNLLMTIAPLTVSLRRLPRGLRSGLLVELLWVQFGVRTIRGVIASQYREVRIALFAYDMLVPPTLSLALGAEGVFRVATLERPNVHLGGLPVILDEWLVPDQHTRNRVSVSPSISVRQFSPVGFWRSDFFFRKAIDENPLKCDVLVLPFTTDCPAGLEDWDVWISPFTFVHFIRSVAEICALAPKFNFVIRTKNDSWIRDPRLVECREIIDTHSNLIADFDFSQEGRAYHLAARSRLLVGKYTSIMDEAWALGKRAVIHNFDQFGSRYNSAGDLWIPDEYLANNQQQFRELVLDGLGRADDRPKNELCDGRVKHRIRELLTQRAQIFQDALTTLDSDD